MEMPTDVCTDIRFRFKTTLTNMSIMNEYRGCQIPDVVCKVMSCEEKRQIYPHDEKIMELASCAFDYLESIYEEAPDPEGYNLAREDWN